MKRARSTKPKAVDFFSGAGGMSLGAEQAGYRVVAAVESDPIHALVHEQNFPQARTYAADAQALSAKELLRDLRLDRGDLDLVFGGPPCQGFSFIGYRDVEDSRNDLVMTFAHQILELEPRAFVMENVPGLLAGDMRPVLDTFIRRLSKRYRIADPVRLLNAVDFGVPQVRKRAFVIGVRRDLNVTPRYPVAKSMPRTTVRDALSDLPTIEGLPPDTDEIPYDRRPIGRFARIMRGWQRDPTDRSEPRDWNHKLATNCRPTTHTDESIKRFTATRPGETEPVSRFYRLRWDGQANTLRAGTGTERGSYTAPRPIHPALPRVITVREAARLHGFPDWFRFHPTKFHGFRQVGNAVCPPVMRAVAAQLREDIESGIGAEEQLVLIDQLAAVGY